jgi:hypothetical protein
VRVIRKCGRKTVERVKARRGEVIKKKNGGTSILSNSVVT